MDTFSSLELPSDRMTDSSFTTANKLKRQGKLTEAIAAYQQAIALNPNFYWSYHNLGETLAQLNQWPAAIEAYEKAIRLNPTAAWSYYQLGLAWAQQEQWKQAITAYSQAIEINPHPFNFYKRLGEAWTKIENFTEAIQAYLKAIEINPTSGWTYFELAEIYIQQGQLNQAITQLEKAVQLNPSISQFQNQLKKIQQQLDQSDGSVQSVHIPKKQHQSPQIAALDLLKQCKDMNMEKFLFNHQQMTVFVAEPKLYNYIASHRQAESHFSLLSFEGLNDSLKTINSVATKNFYLLSTDPLKIEKAIHTIHRWGGKHCYQLIEDLVFSRYLRLSLSEMQKILRSTDSSFPYPQQLYAVVCTPRSGSSYFCELLKKQVGGNPLEHLRETTLYLLKNRQSLPYDFQRWTDCLIRAQTKNGIFGTKLISHFLFHFMHLINQEDKGFLQKICQGLKLIYLVREDKYSQAVSAYVAHQTGIWHANNNQALETQQLKAQDIEYNFESIHQFYTEILKEENRLSTLLDELKIPSLRVNYEMLVENPCQVMTDVSQYLGVNQTFVDIKSDNLRLGNQINTQLISQFKHDLDRHQ